MQVSDAPSGPNISLTDGGRRATWLVLGLILIVATAVRVYAIGEQPFWLDEAHTAEYAKMDLADLWSYDDLYDRANPPGYILLVKIWWQVSKSDEWIRMLSALAGVATVAVVYAVGRRLAGARAGLWASGFLAIAGYHVRYSQEARAYALVTLAAAIAMWAVLHLVSEPEADRATIMNPRWRFLRSRGPSGRRAVTWTDAATVAYGMATGLALHLHNTGIGIVLAANVAVAVWWLRTTPRPLGFLPRWVWAHIVTLLVFLPWIPGFIAQLGVIEGRFWVPEPTAASVTRDLGVVYDAYSDLLWNPLGSLAFHAVVLLAVAVVVISAARRLEPGARVTLVAFVVTQPLFELIYSLRRPVFLSRTLVWILVPTAVCVGVVLANRGSVIARRAAIALIAVQLAGTVGYHGWYVKTPWDRAAELVAEQAAPDDVVLVLAGNTAVAFEHYFQGLGPDIPVIELPWQIPDRTSSGSILTTDDLRAIERIADDYATTWVVLNSVGNIEDGDRLIPALETEAGTSEVTRLRDVQVAQFD